jgi:hypothetical protein
MVQDVDLPEAEANVALDAGPHRAGGPRTAS